MSDVENKIRMFSGEWEVEGVIKELQMTIDGSFFLCNLSDVIRKFNDWTLKLPRVKPFYAVKCNDDRELLKTLATLGCSFDCASAGEIAKILSLNVAPSRIIFANTTKQQSHIEFAQKNNINLMTFDNEEELCKIKKFHSSSELLMRIRCSSKTAKLDLGIKFGCDPTSEAPQLLKLAKKFGLNVVGISFHIGCGTEDFDDYSKAIEISRQVFKVAEEFGFKFEVLDLGGGFPGNNFSDIDQFSVKINDALNKHFSIEEFPSLRVIAEPGRYFTTSAFTLVSKIHSRKILRNDDGQVEQVMYYLNEGVYSSFLLVLLSFVAAPKVLLEKRSDVKFKSTLWGPTCDSIDAVAKEINLELLDINDIVYFNGMGAYTISLRTNFNNFEPAKVLYFVNFIDQSVLKF